MSRRLIPLFTGVALDRADHLRTQPDVLQNLSSGCCLIRIDREGRLAANAAGDALHVQRPAQFCDHWQQASFLGVYQQQAWFAITCDEPAPDVPQWLDLRAAATCFDAFQAGVGAYARALALWQQRTRFCSVCAGELLLTRAGHAAHCRQCGAEHFPRTDPAVIVVISHGDSVLLARQASWPKTRYSLIAGFVEPGESLEDTVLREAMEEVGLPLSDCRYIASQPWPFPASLMLGFSAHAPLQAPRVGSELEDALWITASALRAAIADGSLLPPPASSISRLLLDNWLAQWPDQSAHNV